VKGEIMTSDEEKIIAEVANVSDPNVLEEMTVSTIESRIDDLEAADAGVCASLAHASEVWTC